MNVKIVVNPYKKLARKQRDRGAIIGIPVYENVSVRHIQNKYLTSGEAVLDFDCEDGIDVSWKADDYTTIDGATRNAAVSFTAIASKRNDAILEGVVSDIGKPITTEWGAYIGWGDRRIIEGKLSVARRNMKGRTPQNLDMVLRGEGYNWANLLAVSINELPFRGDGTAGFGEVLFSEANIFDASNWGGPDALLSQAKLGRFVNDDRYREYIALPVNYGFWGAGTAMTLSDLRLWFFERDLIYLAFASIGYKIVSQFINSNYYRKDAVYVLKENYFDQDGELSAKNGLLANWMSDFSANEPFTIPINPPNDTVSPAYDINGNYNNVNGKYTAPANMRVIISGSIVVQNPNPFDFKIGLKYEYQSISGGDPIEHQLIDYIFVLAGGTRTFDFSSEIVLAQGDSIFLYFEIINQPLGLNYTIKAGSYIKVVVKYKDISDGDVLKLANIVDPQITALDILKGAAHRYDWRFETDPDTNTVYIEPAWAYSLPKEQLPLEYQETPGYYGDETTAVNIDKAIDWCGDRTAEGKKEGKKRRLRLTYKEGDAYYKSVSDELVGNSRRLFDGEQYLGEQYEEGVTIEENPLYAGTVNAYDNSISKPNSDAPIIPNFGMWIPHIWESLGEDNSITSRPTSIAAKISPRVIKVFGRKLGLYLFTNAATTTAYTWYISAGMIDAGGYYQQLPNGDNYIYAPTLSYGSQWGGWKDPNGNTKSLVTLGGRDVVTGQIRKLGLIDCFWANSIEELRSGVWETFDYMPYHLPYSLILGKFRKLLIIDGILYRIENESANIADLKKIDTITVVRMSTAGIETQNIKQLPPPPTGLRITFLPGSPELEFSLAQWNTAFQLPALGSPFTSISVVGNEVTLLGGAGITMSGYFINNQNITGIYDDNNCIVNMSTSAFFGTTSMVDAVLNGTSTVSTTAFTNSSIQNASFTSATFVGQQAFDSTTFLNNILLPNAITIGQQAFAGSSILSIDTPLATSYGSEAFAFGNSLQVVNAPLVTNIGNGCFNNDYSLVTLYMPSCISMGVSSGNNNVFDNIFANTMTLTVSVVLQTNNTGSPDGDIQNLLATSPLVTIVYI